jgi:hypothetical protein
MKEVPFGQEPGPAGAGSAVAQLHKNGREVKSDLKDMIKLSSVPEL